MRSSSNLKKSSAAVSSDSFRTPLDKSGTDISVVPGSRASGFARKIWLDLAGPHYQHYKAQMRVFPYLWFKQSQVEAEYAKYTATSYIVRSPIAAFVLLLVQIVVWIMEGVLIDQKKVYIHDYRWTPALHLIYLFNSLCLGFLCCINMFPRLGNHMEVLFYVATCPFTLLDMIWMISVYVDAIRRADQLILAGKTSVLIALQFKFWTDTAMITVLFALITVYDQFMTPRSRAMLYVHVIFTALYVTTKVMMIWALRSPFIHAIYAAIVLTQIMQTFVGLTMMIQAYIGRWQKEFVERVAFLNIRADQLRLKDLREAQKKRKKGKGETEGESLIFAIKKAQTAVQSAAFEKSAQGDTSLLEMDEVLRQVIEILLDTDDLFAVGAVTDATDGTEDQETLYINMFQLTHKGAKIKPPKRKTGDDYVRHIFDQQEFFTPDILPDFNFDSNLQREVGQKATLKLLDVFESDPLLLVNVGLILLAEHTHILNVPQSCVTKYLYQVNRRYFSNPYHNACHGAMVGHMAVVISKLLNVYTSVSTVDRVSLVLGGLVHDMGHPGRNNNYYVNSCGFLAKLYNDQSILEMYHSFLAFRYANIGSEVNIFQNLTPDQYVAVRSNMIEFILVTDMSQHFASISKFRVRRASEKFDFSKNPDDATLVLKCIMKMGDLSHGLVDWPQHMDWSLRVCSEFYQQGAEEEQLGLPVSPLCDASAHQDWCKSQAGFLQFVVIPLANELAEIDESGLFNGELVTKVLFNKHKWEMLKEKGEYIRLPDHIAKCSVAPMHFAECTAALALKAKTVDEINADPLSATDMQALVNHSEAAQLLQASKVHKGKLKDHEEEEYDEEEDEEEEEVEEEEEEPEEEEGSIEEIDSLLSPRRRQNTEPLSARGELITPRSNTFTSDRSSRFESRTYLSDSMSPRAEIISPRSDPISPREALGDLLSPRDDIVSPRSAAMSPHLEPMSPRSDLMSPRSEGDQ